MNVEDRPKVFEKLRDHFITNEPEPDILHPEETGGPIQNTEELESSDVL
jgi:hypothetical protein